jgi:hypothetical protein
MGGSPRLEPARGEQRRRCREDESRQEPARRVEARRVLADEPQPRREDGARATDHAPTVSATAIATEPLADATVSGATGYVIEGLVRGLSWVLVDVANAGASIGYADRAWLVLWVVDGATLVVVVVAGLAYLVDGVGQVVDS